MRCIILLAAQERAAGKPEWRPVQAGLARMDLVTREEFDVQAELLARTRALLDAMEKRLAALEQALSGKDASR